MHPHSLRLALGTQFTAVVLEVADQFLLLRVNGDRRLASDDCRFHRRVDVGELGIPVRVLAALSRLAVGLTTVVQLAQQVGDDALAGREPQISERLDELTLTAADPAQGRTWITTDRGLDHPFQRRRQAGLMSHGTLAPGAGAAHAPVNVVASRLKLVDAAINRAPRDPRRQSGCGDTAKPKGQGFIGGKQPTPALVEKRGDQLPARADVIKVDHGSRVIPGRRVAPTEFVILSLRSQGPVDSIISPQALSSERASDVAHISRLLTVDEVDQVAGGNFNRAGTYAGGLAQPGFKNPTVIYDDG